MWSSSSTRRMTVDDVGGRKALAAQAEAIVRRGQARALAGLARPDGRRKRRRPDAGRQRLR